MLFSQKKDGLVSLSPQQVNIEANFDHLPMHREQEPQNKSHKEPAIKKSDNGQTSITMAGGYKIPLSQQQNHQEEEFQQQRQQFLEARQNNPYVPGTKEDVLNKFGLHDTQQYRAPEVIDEFNIDQRFLHSNNLNQVQSQFSDQLIEELQLKRKILQDQREELLEQRRENQQKQLGASRSASNLNSNYTGKLNNLVGLGGKSSNGRDPNDYLLQRIEFENIQGLVNGEWKDQKPSIEIVQTTLTEHRQKLKEIQERFYKQKTEGFEHLQMSSKPIYFEDNMPRKVANAKLRGDYGETQFIPTNFMKIGGVDKKDAFQKENNGFRGAFDKPSIPMEQQISMKIKRKKIIEQQMKEINKMMEQKPTGAVGEGQYTFLRPTDAVYENATYVPIERKLHQQQFQQYKIEQQIKKTADIKFEELVKPEFERYKSQQSFQKSQKFKQAQLAQLGEGQFPITERPVKQVDNYAEIEEEQQKYQVEVMTEKLKNEVKDSELQHMRELYRRIIENAAYEKDDQKKKDEQFILQYLFMQIDQSRTGVVSQTEVHDNIKRNKEAIIFFDLCMQTFFNDLEQYPSQRNGLLNTKEFCQFMRCQRDIAKQSLIEQKKDLEQQMVIENQQLSELLIKQDPRLMQATEGTCILSEKHIDELRKVFNQVDKYSDYIIPRVQLVQALRNNSLTGKFSDLPAVKIPIIDQIIPFGGVLDQILNQYLNERAQYKQSKEYVSWNQFFDYFRQYSQTPAHLRGNQEYSQEESNYILNKELLQLLQDIFDMQSRITLEYVNTGDFVLSCKRDPQIRAYKDQLARNQSKETGLPQETIEQVLDRIMQEASQYIDWQETIEFFSQRGRPSSSDGIQGLGHKNSEYASNQQMLGFTSEYNTQKSDSKQSLNNNAQRSQVHFQDQLPIKLNNNYLKNSQNFKYSIDEQDDEYQDIQYDQLDQLDDLRNAQKQPMSHVKKGMDEEISDFYSVKRTVVPQESAQEKNQKDLNNFDQQYQALMLKQKQVEDMFKPDDPQDLRKMQMDYKEYANTISKIQADKKTLTVPQPPKFEERNQDKKQSTRQMKVEAMIEQKQKQEEDAINFQFKAKPIPTQVKVPLFNTVMQKNEERKQIVKENAKQMTEENAKPFSFYEREKARQQQKKEKIQQNLEKEKEFLQSFQFQAKEIPVTSKVEVLQQKQDEEQQAREERIKQRVEENLKSVKMPARMAEDEKEWIQKSQLKKQNRAWEVDGTGKEGEQLPCTFKPKINKSSADEGESSKKSSYLDKPQTSEEKAHEVIEKMMKQNPITNPQPFNFKQPQPQGTKPTYLDDDNQNNIPKPPRPNSAAPSNSSSNPNKKVNSQKSEPQEDEGGEEEVQEIQKNSNQNDGKPPKSETAELKSQKANSEKINSNKGSKTKIPTDEGEQKIQENEPDLNKVEDDDPQPEQNEEEPAKQDQPIEGEGDEYQQEFQQEKEEENINENENNNENQNIDGVDQNKQPQEGGQQEPTDEPEEQKPKQEEQEQNQKEEIKVTTNQGDGGGKYDGIDPKTLKGKELKNYQEYQRKMKDEQLKKAQEDQIKREEARRKLKEDDLQQKANEQQKSMKDGENNYNQQQKLLEEQLATRQQVSDQKSFGSSHLDQLRQQAAAASKSGGAAEPVQNEGAD